VAARNAGSLKRDRCCCSAALRGGVTDGQVGSRPAVILLYLDEDLYWAGGEQAAVPTSGDDVTV
jgi:hypothetical protein